MLKVFKKNGILITLIMLSFLPGAEIDICISAFPVIKRIFNLSTFHVEYLLTFNLIFHVLCAFFMGQLADIYGKKKVILIGLLIFVVGCGISCIPDFYFILTGRILQGIGSAAPMIIVNLIVMDIYAQDKKKQREMLSTLGGIAIVGISAAPVIGAKMTTFLGWQGGFVFLNIFGILAIILSLIFLPKDNIILIEKIEKQDNYPANYSKCLYKIKNHFRFLKDKKMILYLLYLTTGACAYYTYLSMSSMLYIEVFKVSLANFGYFQGTTAFVFGTMSFLNGALTRRLGSKNMLKISLFFIISFLILEIIAIKINLRNPYLFCIMMLFSSAGMVFPINLMYSSSLHYAGSQKGKFSSINLILRWLATVITVQLASYFYNYSIISTISINFTMTLVALILMFVIIKKDKDLKEEFINH